jgi:3-dehydroquinate dehydratase / shikimate dehydrogenase
MPAPQLESERCILRQWKDEDLSIFTKMNQDPLVMEFFPATLTASQSKKLAENIQQELQTKPYGLWAVELKKGHSFIGFAGLHEQNFEAPFCPCIELGYRLDPSFWGHGFATECGKTIFRYAFETVQLEEVVSFTFIHNFRSRKVMERLGMTHNPEDDFMHPKLAAQDPLRPHVLYRMTKERYLSLS